LLSLEANLASSWEGEEEEGGGGLGDAEVVAHDLSARLRPVAEATAHQVSL
jgi:hypothetical protein